MALRIVVISDTHGLHEQIAVPTGDVLIHAGDLTARGRREELEAFNGWLSGLPHPHKLVIAGNHDLFCARGSALIRRRGARSASALPHRGDQPFPTPAAAPCATRRQPAARV